MVGRNLDKKQYYITLVVIAFLVMFTVTAIWWTNDRTKIKVDCSIKGIELINVSPYDCYIGDIRFINEFCPVPKDLSCSFELEGLAKLGWEGFKILIDG